MPDQLLYSPSVQAAVKAGQREFVLNIRKRCHDAPLFDWELRQIVYLMSGFDRDPLTRDLEEARKVSMAMPAAKGAAYLTEATAEINRRFQQGELIGMRNSPYHFTFLDHLDRWNHYQAYEVS